MLVINRWHLLTVPLNGDSSSTTGFEFNSLRVSLLTVLRVVCSIARLSSGERSIGFDCPYFLCVWVRFGSIAELNRTQSKDWVRLCSIEIDWNLVWLGSICYTGHRYVLSSHCTGRYEFSKLTSLPMCAFIAQLVEHRTGISRRSRVRIPLKPWFFSGFFFPIYCDDHSSLSDRGIVWIIYVLFREPRTNGVSTAIGLPQNICQNRSEFLITNTCQFQLKLSN